MVVAIRILGIFLLSACDRLIAHKIFHATQMLFIYSSPVFLMTQALVALMLSHGTRDLVNASVLCSSSNHGTAVKPTVRMRAMTMSARSELG